jgi:hypothetical protein
VAAESSERRDALVERMRGSTLGAMDVVTVYIGVRLGLYRALADRGPSSSAELADAADLNERYVREWLEQQATTGILDVDDDAASPAAGPRRGAPRRDQPLPPREAVVACVRPIGRGARRFRSGVRTPTLR